MCQMSIVAVLFTFFPQMILQASFFVVDIYYYFCSNILFIYVILHIQSSGNNGYHPFMPIRHLRERERETFSKRGNRCYRDVLQTNFKVWPSGPLSPLLTSLWRRGYSANWNLPSPRLERHVVLERSAEVSQSQYHDTAATQGDVRVKLREQMYLYEGPHASMSN